MRKRMHYPAIITYLLVAGALTGCGQAIPDTPILTESAISESFRPDTIILDDNSEKPPGEAAVPGQENVLKRDTTPVCLVPSADGTAETHNDEASIDYSNASEGYVMVSYTGECPKVKLRIIGPDSIEYTYDLHGNGYETFPFSSGSGSYNVTVYENFSGTSYSTCLHAKVSVELKDEFTPFLYPNQYVNFTLDSKSVQKGAELAAAANSDLEVVEKIYNYIVSDISYDYNKASDPPIGYTTDVDEIMECGTGICLDYAAVMASMLRSQQIPTRLEIGYARDTYHAWISIYIEEIGWLNGIIEFDGTGWTLVDPTFGASTDNKTLKKFIGDGSNYVLQRMY